MATVTSEHGGYFMFKVIEFEKNLGDSHFSFHKMISFSILNNFYDFKKFYHGKQIYYEFSHFTFLKNFGMT
jgi:hypothetical protein